MLALLVGLLVALAGPARAQDTGGINYGDGGDKKWWDPDGVSNCQGNSPIAGTAGYRNASAAITTNATTYGAAQWAERNLFPMVHRRDLPQKATGAGAMETNLVFTATRVPSVEGGYPFGDCPYDHRVSMRALDLGASNFGLAVKKGRLGLFYAGSLTWSSSAFANNAARGMVTGSYVIWGGVGAAAAPALGGWEYEQGVSTISPDWILGATVDATYVFAEAGYVGSTGFYGHVQEGTVGFFGSALVQKGIQGLPFYKAGADRVESPAGLSSLYARKLPLQALPRYGDDSGAPQRDGDTEIEDSLQTVHLEQLNLGGIADVLVAGAWTPSPQLLRPCPQLPVAVDDPPPKSPPDPATEAALYSIWTSPGLIVTRSRTRDSASRRSSIGRCFHASITASRKRSGSSSSMPGTGRRAGRAASWSRAVSRWASSGADITLASFSSMRPLITWAAVARIRRSRSPIRASRRSRSALA